MLKNRLSGQVLNHATVVLLALTGAAAGAYGQAEAPVGAATGARGCATLPKYAALKAALASATATEMSGLNNQMWATIVDRDGVVCAVAFSGMNRAAQWPGSRVISAQKANTAHAFG